MASEELSGSRAAAAFRRTGGPGTRGAASPGWTHSDGSASHSGEARAGLTGGAKEENVQGKPVRTPNSSGVTAGKAPWGGARRLPRGPSGGSPACTASETEQVASARTEQESGLKSSLQMHKSIFSINYQLLKKTDRKKPRDVRNDWRWLLSMKALGLQGVRASSPAYIKVEVHLLWLDKTP